VSITLRPYQERDIERIRTAVREKFRRILYVLPTGGGKTTIASEIIRCAVAKGSRLFFVAHRKELIDQTSRRLDDMGVSHGVVMADHHRRRPDLPVQVVSIQTAIRRELAWSPDIVFVDECHRIAGDSYRDFIAECGNPVLIGITATPIRGDQQGLGGDLFQTMVVGPQMSELIEQGYLVKPRVFSWKVNLKGVKITAGDYNSKQLEERMSDTKLVGDVFKEWHKHCSDRTTVIFASGVNHSKLILTDFIANGVIAEHLDAKTPKHEREEILARLANGETQVVTNVGILTEGWDCPRVSAISIVRPTRSKGLYMQMSGRALRPYPGKDGCIILDHGGCAIEFGVPHGEQEWDLDDKRKKKSDKLDIKDKIKVCPECGEVYEDINVATCICGYEFSRKKDKIKIADEPLSEYDGSPHTDTTKKRHDYEWWLYQQKTLTKADGSPYSQGFAFAKYMSKYKEKPPWAWKTAWEKKHASQ